VANICYVKTPSTPTTYQEHGVFSINPSNEYKSSDGTELTDSNFDANVDKGPIKHLIYANIKGLWAFIKDKASAAEKVAAKTAFDSIHCFDANKTPSCSSPDGDVEEDTSFELEFSKAPIAKYQSACKFKVKPKNDENSKQKFNITIGTSGNIGRIACASKTEEKKYVPIVISKEGTTDFTSTTEVTCIILAQNTDTKTGRKVSISITSLAKLQVISILAFTLIHALF